MLKSKRLEELYGEYKKSFFENEIVFGDGNINTRLLLIGEAPGKDEVKLLKPFVGAAGKNLEAFLDMLGINRASIYITNAIKYRLSALNPRTGRIVNRPASKEEINQNRHYLLQEIRIINPEYIVTLGNVPLRAVIGEANISIGKVHGKHEMMTISGDPYILFPLYHPASIIYNKKLKDIYVDDVRKLKVVINSGSCV